MDLFMELLKTFVVGGVICIIGQILLDRTKLTGGRIMVLFLLAGA
ncbi:MAG: stage sporulation protein, partial [Clostridia bacterium]|nr:stage sporulation protein [Clostridia bacterium]